MEIKLDPVGLGFVFRAYQCTARSEVLLKVHADGGPWRCPVCGAHMPMVDYEHDKGAGYFACIDKACPNFCGPGWLRKVEEGLCFW